VSVSADNGSTADPAPKTSRAGRDLPAAIAVGGALVVGSVLVVIWRRPAEARS